MNCEIRTPNHRPLRRLIWIIAIATGTCLAVTLVLILRERWLRVVQEPFEAQAWQSASAVALQETRTIRQRMIRDLVTNILPGKRREEIEDLLGRSRTHADMKRHSNADFIPLSGSEAKDGKPFPQSGEGSYFDEHGWDLLYPIGKERSFVFDHSGVFGGAITPDDEFLILRLDADDRFESWYIVGSTRWPEIVGAPGNRLFRPTRPGRK